MAQINFKSLVFGCTLLATVTTLGAIDSVYRNGADNQLTADDRAIDAQILETIQKIQNLHALKDLKSLHLSPQQTRVRLNGNGDCIEVDAHTENHEMPTAKSAPVDYKVQKIRLCFAKDKLTRIESAFTAISIIKQEKSVNSFVHKDPTKIAVNDIELNGSFNDQKLPALRIGDLQNSVNNPLRTSFKRDYYLPHLRNTVYILQLTFDLHRKEAEKANEKAVNQYLNYTQ